MKRLLQTAAAAATVGALALPALAYEWGGAKWEVGRGEGVPYYVSQPLSDDLPDRDALEAIQRGHDVWTAVTCSYITWDFQGRTESTTWGASDGKNINSWRESGWTEGGSVLGITATSWGFNGLSDTDIKYNGQHHSWANFRDAPGGFDGRTDIASVAAHEVGHALGFGHSDVRGSTMWPSTGPGDISGRSLGPDDIAAVCEVYPSGGEVPEPDDDTPPAPGMAGFGEDCAMTRCAENLFCVNDGRDSYCSRSCNPEGDNTCGDGYYCALLSGGDGACARGEDPARNLAGFGEVCGEEVRCQPGLVCINDDGSLYCTGPCVNGNCPEEWFCAELSTGESICARGGPGDDGPLPQQGDACNDRGLCERGLFCLNDSLNIDENTGEAVPYCTGACEGGRCEDGYRCVEVAPSGTACQKIPSAGDRFVGDACWVNPETPWVRPECGDGLVCVDYEQTMSETIDPGFCTKNCKVDDCCPEGWGCVELTPVIGQCREGQADSPSFECAGERPPSGPDDPPPTSVGDGGVGGGGGGPGGDIDRKDGGDSGGCAVRSGRGQAPAGLLAVLLGLGLVARRRRHG